MRIAYIVFYKDASPGIKKTLRDKARALDDIGADNVDIIVVNFSRNEIMGRLHYVGIDTLPFPLNYLDFFFRRYRLVERALQSRQYDIMVLRYPFADPSGISFMNKNRVITEHHTMELPEKRANMAHYSSFAERMVQRLRYWLEKTFGSKIIERSLGLCGVTNEICEYELSRVAKKVPAATIPNGIRVEKVPFTGCKQFNGNCLDIAFLAGSGSPWHGLDRIYDSLSQYDGDVHIKLHLIGNYGRTEHDICPKKNYFEIVDHGRLYGEDLDDVLSNMHIAFSTMALFRNQMEEGCTLKTREYTARGLPFVLAYNDPDLSCVTDNKRFFLQFPNNRSPIDFNKVIRFVRELNEDGVKKMSEYMRDYARTHMDWTAKMERYIDFAEQVAMQEKLPNPPESVDKL